MRWNPYIEVYAEVSRAVRSKCKACEVEIEKGDWRVKAIPIVGKPDLLHVDCAAKRAPDLVQRKIKDEAADWPAEVRERAARYVPEGTEPAPRSYQRTPIADISYAKSLSGTSDCEFCGTKVPGDPGPTHGHGVRAFFLGGEYLFHPVCILQLAPGICLRIAAEDSERWPAKVKALFKAAAEGKVRPTLRSPWRNTAGIPKLEPAPSGRAGCRFCDEKIAKGELRFAREQLYGMRRSPVYFHVSCFCNSADYHPKWLELAVVRVDRGAVSREQIEELGPALPPTAGEDDDVTPLLERLLTLYDAIPRPDETEAEDEGPQLTENVVEIPRGFFNS